MKNNPSCLHHDSVYIPGGSLPGTHIPQYLTVLPAIKYLFLAVLDKCILNPLDIQRKSHFLHSMIPCDSFRLSATHRILTYFLMPCQTPQSPELSPAATRQHSCCPWPLNLHLAHVAEAMVSTWSSCNSFKQHPQKSSTSLNGQYLAFTQILQSSS